MELTREILTELGAAFPEDEIKFLPKSTSNGKALAIPYLDARAVMRRLDAVVGPGNWAYDFDMLTLDGKMVRGRLTVLGVTKTDAGEASKEEEVLKSAVSDALKRVAVHFGIGRYLYFLPRVWAAYDAQRRQFTETPQISPAAIKRALSICGFGPAPTPESRGDQRAQQPPPPPASSPAPPAEAGREQLIEAVKQRYAALHETPSEPAVAAAAFWDWVEKLALKRELEHRRWGSLLFADLKKLEMHLRTEAAVLEGQARQAGQAPLVQLPADDLMQPLAPPSALTQGH